MKTKKVRLLWAAILFAAFAALLLTATFYDLQISAFLTKNALPAGQYYATDVFGVGFECVGTAPEPLFGALCAALAMEYMRRRVKNGKLRLPLTALFAALTAVFYAWEFRDLFEYVERHFAAAEHGTAFLWVVIAFLALLCAALTFAAVGRCRDETLGRLFRFSVYTAVGIIAAILLVQAVKVPMGRMRYRAMNVLGDFSGFRRWYVPGGQPDKAWMKAVFGTSDAFKSFPSGHTRAAAASFYLIALADALGVTDKKKRAALWCFAAAFTAAVAVSRIVVGAHFLSDVLVGGAVGFCVCMLCRLLLARRADAPDAAINSSACHNK